MQCSTSTNAGVTSYSQGTSSQEYTAAARNWVHSVGQKLSATFGQSDNTTQELPQHSRNSPPTTSSCAPGGSNPAQPQSLHLMGCMQHDQDHHKLYQDRIEHITTDRELFSFMKSQLAQRRGYIHKIFTCTCIQGIRFVKVRTSNHTAVNTSTDLASSSTFGPMATQRSATTGHFAPHQRPRIATVYHQRTKSKVERMLSIDANPSPRKIPALHSHPPS
jgi:hypothetical protein